LEQPSRTAPLEMQTHTLIDTLREALGTEKAGGKSVGLVPTMGNLHAGHLALVREARRNNEIVVVSIFVNPLQFGPNEDFDAYPRTLEEDQAKLAMESTDYVFAPAAGEIYPKPIEETTTVAVPVITDILCGTHRPGHFDGVTTVVTKLFNIVQPHRAYFGQKDYQQLVVIRTMVRDLDMPIEIVGVPIVRDEDGLALSSRNQYLGPEERSKARELHRALLNVKRNIEAGDVRSHDEITAEAKQNLEEHGFRPDYVEVRTRADLSPAQASSKELIVLGAAYLGRTRLIDNVAIDPNR
jgi:pantoate--beta-alanine ligase